VSVSPLPFGSDPCESHATPHSKWCVHHAERVRASPTRAEVEPITEAVGRDMSPSRLMSPERLESPESSKRSVGKKGKASGAPKRRQKICMVQLEKESTGTTLDSKGIRLFHLMRMFALNYTITGDMMLSLIQVLGRGGGFPSEEVRPSD
jgi:hypothetical protein